MTAQEFLDLSTKLVADLQAWVAEAGKDDTLSTPDLETIRGASQIIERVTLKEVGTKSAEDPEGHILL
jgi:hypothetical protein